MRIYLQKIRKDKKLTQADVASELGMATTAYSMLETGLRQKDMDLSIAVGLAKVFEVSIDYIIAEEEKLKNCGVV